MPIIDTHSHLYLSEFNEDMDLVIQRAKAANIAKILMPNIDIEYTKKIKNIVFLYPEMIRAMIGIHPTNIGDNFDLQIRHIESELNSGFSYCAIGEIGIDLYWDKTFFEQQKIAFRKQMDLAQTNKLPVSIHQRSAINETFDIIKDYNGLVNGVLHCFSGEISDAKTAIDLGYKLGIGGVITFKNSNLPEIVSYVGINHIVLETDAPYLAPIPLRGKRNEPAYLKFIVSLLSQLLKIDENKVEETTTNNAKSIFKKI